MISPARPAEAAIKSGLVSSRAERDPHDGVELKRVISRMILDPA
jgi:hypothetical protein